MTRMAPTAFGLVVLLAGCANSPAPEFRNALKTDVVRDGRSYQVYHDYEKVEVVRLGWAGRSEHRAIRATMIALIPEVTGCRLIEGTLEGDSGEMRGRISCQSGL
ncbi:MAG: hypothetical protein R3D84_04385 [Paracoccaceae bacterium]